MTALAANLPTADSVIARALAGDELGKGEANGIATAEPRLTIPNGETGTNGLDLHQTMERVTVQDDRPTSEEKPALPEPEAGKDVEEAGDEEEGDEDDDEDEDEEDEDEEEEEDDVDAQAEAFAKSLGDQLLAQIGAAFGQPPAPAQPPGANGAAHPPSTEHADPLVSTIQVVLQHAASDSHLMAIMQHTVVPGYANLLQCLQHVAATGDVQEETAEMLSNLISTIASGSLPPAPPPPLGLIPQESRKRKRDDTDGADDGPNRKRATPQQVQELKAHLFATIAVISHALVLNNAAEGHITKGAPSRAQAEQILHFAHACAHRAEADDIDLSELGALVWMLRSLSGITPPHEGGPTIPIALDSSGRAVYPCVHQHCGLTFPHLVDLRMHQEQAHEGDRPFRCKRCPASFMRNHDLKRHYNLHEKRAFVCRGCNKVYTRRDALKRHKDHPKSDDACRTTDVVELPRGSHGVVGGLEGVSPGGVAPAAAAQTTGGATQQTESEQSVSEQAHAVVSQLFSILAAQQPQQSQSQQAQPQLSFPAPPTVDNNAPVAVTATQVQADPASALSSFGLSAEHTQLLQRAIAMTAESARQQAEREAQAEDYESESGEGSEDEEGEDAEDEEGVEVEAGVGAAEGEQGGELPKAEGGDVALAPETGQQEAPPPEVG